MRVCEVLPLCPTACRYPLVASLPVAGTYALAHGVVRIV